MSGGMTKNGGNLDAYIIVGHFIYAPMLIRSPTLITVIGVML